MSVISEQQAYILAQVYNFMPPLPVYPARNRAINSGKFERDYDEQADTRCMVLAHFSGSTNVIVQYVPDDLEY